jgi:diguanylate cyclase (GGDEF)-like protein/PAS domain S-box-containing protein
VRTTRCDEHALHRATALDHLRNYQVKMKPQPIQEPVQEPIQAQESLSQESLSQESLFSRVFHASSLSICITTLDSGQMVAFNKSCAELFGYPAEVLARSSTVDLGIWHDPGERAEAMRILLEHGRYESVEAQLVRADGQVRDTVMTMELLDLEAGRCVLTFARDVTDQRRAEACLRESEERFRQSFTFAAIGKAIVALDGRWIEVNPALCAILGYSEAEFIQRTFQDITHPDDLDADLNHIRELCSGAISTYQMEKRYIHRQGHEVWALLCVSLVHDGVGQPLYLIFEIQDISDRKRYEQQIAGQRLALEAANATLKQLATTDSLTGLENRRAFDVHLKREVARAARRQVPVSLLLLDVDHFKAYNDAFGHPAGDAVLRQVAQLVGSQARGTDITARHGGEEFAVILPDTDRVGALAAAERFCKGFGSLSWPERAVTASIGSATWMPPNTQVKAQTGSATTGSATTGSAATLRICEELVSQADRALYRAKSNGRNRVSHAADPN